MTRKESVDERLTRLVDYWNKVTANFRPIEDRPSDKSTPEQIASKFGLSASQARAWLEKEPNYTADEFSHEPKNRQRLHRTAVFMLRFWKVYVEFLSLHVEDFSLALKP